MSCKKHSKNVLFAKKAYKKPYFLVDSIVDVRPEKSTVSIITYEDVFCCIFSSHLFAE